mgnify:CR=1 FL=1
MILRAGIATSIAVSWHRLSSCCTHRLSTGNLTEVSERIALVLAFGGVILIATHGDLTQLTVSKTTLFLGLASALATVFYNLLPGNLMSEYGTFAIVGWGMLISGIGLIPIVRPWTTTAQIIWDWQTFCV